MSGPEILLVEAARRDTRLRNTLQLLAYAQSEGAEPGQLFEEALASHRRLSTAPREAILTPGDPGGGGVPPPWDGEPPERGQSSRARKTPA